MLNETASYRFDSNAALESSPQVGSVNVPFNTAHADVRMHWWQTMVLCREWGHVSSWLAGPSSLGSLADPEMWQTAANWRSRFSPLPKGTPWRIDGGGVVVMDIDHSTLITLQNPLFPSITFREARRIRISRKWRHLLSYSASITHSFLQPKAFRRTVAGDAASNGAINGPRKVVYCPQGWDVKGDLAHLTPDEALFSFLMEMRQRMFAPPIWKSVQDRLDTIKEDMSMVVAEGRQVQLDRLRRDWTHASSYS